jgi:purine-nucleoside phosphorylase
MEAPLWTLVEELEPLGVGEARLAVVLGSGLGDFARRLDRARSIPYAELRGMPASTVPGHAGRLVLGELAGVRLVVQEGRRHRYEGARVEEVTRAVRAFAALGVGGLLLTNAAGGLRPEWTLPALMRVLDHVDLQAGRRPGFSFETGAVGRSNVAHRRLQLPVGSDRSSGRRGGPDGDCAVYDADAGRAIDLAAKEAGIPIVHGIYAGLLGPSYETPAEIRMLRWLGADAVGMSTVAEAAAARLAGMRVAAVSCITNPAAGIASGPLSHAEVVAAGASAAERFAALLEAALPRFAALG